MELLGTADDFLNLLEDCCRALPFIAGLPREVFTILVDQDKVGNTVGAKLLKGVAACFLKFYSGPRHVGRFDIFFHITGTTVGANKHEFKIGMLELEIFIPFDQFWRELPAGWTPMGRKVERGVLRSGFYFGVGKIASNVVKKTSLSRSDSQGTEGCNDRQERQMFHRTSSWSRLRQLATCVKK